MKYIFFFCFISAFTFCFAAPLQAQGLFFRLDGGYNFAYDSDWTVSRTYPDNLTKRVDLDYARSASFCLRAGYMFTSHIGADIGIRYHPGQPIEIRSSSYDTGFNTERWWSVNRTLSFNAVLFTPSVIFSANSEKTFVPYLRAGLVIGVPSKLSDEYESVSNQTDFAVDTTYYSVNQYSEREETTYRIGVGITGGAGLDWHIGKRWGIFAELNVTALQFRPEKRVLTRSTNNGRDELPTYTTNRKEIVYVDEITRNATQNSPPDQPLRSVFWEYLAYNHINVNLGVKIRL